VVVDDLAEPLEDLADLFAVSGGALGDIVLSQLDQVSLRCEDGSHVLDPRDVFTDGRVGDFELFRQRMECDPDTNGLVVLGQNLAPSNPAISAVTRC
jgi:hypothetical protein